MTGLLMVAGVVLVGVTGWLAVRFAVLPRLQFEQHLRQVESYGFGRDSGEAEDLAERGGLARLLAPIAERVGRWMIVHVPRVPSLGRGDLAAAGLYEPTPELVHGYRVIATTAVALVMALLVVPGGLSLLKVALVLGAVALTWQGPASLIGIRGRKRLDAIDRSLPQFIDLVVATVEAGISFGGALNGAATRFRGPLGEELRLAMQQQNLGMSTEHALRDMLERCDTPSVRAFVKAVSRAESHGVSIGPMMRHLAHDIRQRRRDVARERIQKAPVKLLFPLVLLILPALILMIMFPAMYNILHVISGT